MRNYDNYYCIQNRLESQRHWMNLLCMGKRNLLRYIDKNPSDKKAIKVKNIMWY